jgi:hypothetical protein
VIGMETLTDQWLRVRDRLAANAVDLLVRGSFTAKMISGRKSWELRFRVHQNGRRRHRSIHVGNAKLKAKAEAWLIELREILVWQREIETWARMAAWLSFRLAPRNVATNWGHKRKRRQFAS